MKKNFLFAFIAMTLSFSAMAQYDSDLKPFKVDVSAGYALVSGTGSKSGALFAVEPKYAVSPMLALGLRMEVAVVARFSGYDTNGDETDVTVSGSGSYLATADAYFSDNYSFRPFAGAGGGIYTLASADSNSDDISSGAKFGGMVRAGFEMRHFRVGLEYNFVPKSTFDSYDMNGDPAKLTSKNSYIGFKVGVCIGGGPR